MSPVLSREGVAVWEPIALPSLPGRLVAVSEPVGDRLTAWTTAGVYLLRIDPPVRLLETLPPQRGPERFDRTDGTFHWRGVHYRMHGACGPQGKVVGEPLPNYQRLGQSLERQGARLLIRDVSGAVRQQVPDRASRARWSVAGFCGYGGEFLLVARPGSLRLFRFVGSPEGCGALWQRGGDRRQQQGFLRAIAEDPEDTSRLVYADWLDEHGDPLRAEFIRARCRIAQREQSAEVPFGDPDEERARLLGGTFADLWAAELPALPGVRYWFATTYRGFPMVMFRNPDDLIRQGERILAATPIESVSFQRLPRTHLARLLRSPYPDRFCRLSVRHLPAGSEAGLTQWLTGPRASRLRRLEFYNCAVSGWTEILRAVGASESLGRLEEVRLREYIPQPPAEAAVLALARSPHLPRLRYVDYNWWHLYPRRTKAELRRRFPAIDLK